MSSLWRKMSQGTAKRSTVSLVDVVGAMLHLTSEVFGLLTSCVLFLPRHACVLAVVCLSSLHLAIFPPSKPTSVLFLGVAGDRDVPIWNASTTASCHCGCMRRLHPTTLRCRFLLYLQLNLSSLSTMMLGLIYSWVLIDVGWCSTFLSVSTSPSLLMPARQASLSCSSGGIMEL